jgi:Glycine-rich domain-containing protein-like
MSIDTFLYNLEQLNLLPIARKLMSPIDGYGWTFQQTEVAIARYKMFLHLQFLFPDAELTPTKEIDEVWHAHILADTRKYFQDCENLYGYILHHRSNEMPQQNSDVASVQTQTLFEEFFGIGVLSDINYQAAPCVSLPISACVTLPGNENLVTLRTHH